MTLRLNVFLSGLLLVAWASILVPKALAQPPRPRPPFRRPAAPVIKPTTQKKDEPAKEKPKKPDRFFAVTGAIVHTVTGPTLNGVTVLANNGKIVAIGHEVAIPEKTEILDATGFHLYPGLVAVSSSGMVGNDPPEDNTDVFSFTMTLGLSGGITTAVSGNTAAKLSYGTIEDHFLRRNIFHTLSYSSRSPDAKRKIRQQFERVRKYLRELDVHEQEKKLDPKATPPKKLTGSDENILKLMKGERNAVATADNVHQIRELAELAEMYNIRIVVRGATEAWIVAPEMGRADMCAIITPRRRSDRDERTNRQNGSSIENARILYDHGVTFAIIPGSSSVSTSGLAGRGLRHLPMEAAFAVRGGLSDDAAVRAITIDAARLLGVDHRVGSVEVGKDADFVIVDGDLLHYMTMVRWTVVNGRIAYDKKKEALFDHIRPDGDRDAPPPPDYWPRRLGQPVPDLDLKRTTEPETEKPDTEKPDTEKPDTEKPDTEKPDTEKPDTEKPDTEKPAAKKPAAKK